MEVVEKGLSSKRESKDDGKVSGTGMRGVKKDNDVA